MPPRRGHSLGLSFISGKERIMPTHYAPIPVSPGGEAPEVSTYYASDDDRYIVSLVVGYRHSYDGASPSLESPRAAAYWAYQLTRDEDAGHTLWYVFDRGTRVGQFFDQHEFVNEFGDFPDGDS